MAADYYITKIIIILQSLKIESIPNLLKDKILIKLYIKFVSQILE